MKDVKLPILRIHVVRTRRHAYAFSIILKVEDQRLGQTEPGILSFVRMFALIESNMSRYLKKARTELMDARILPTSSLAIDLQSIIAKLIT